MSTKHIEFMKVAITEAEKARKMGEIPIGALLVADNKKVLAAEHNSHHYVKRSDSPCRDTGAALSGSTNRQLQIVKYNAICYGRACPCAWGRLSMPGSRSLYRYARSQWGAAGSLYNFAE